MREKREKRVMNFILEKLLITSVNHRCNYQNNSNNTSDKQINNKLGQIFVTHMTGKCYIPS